MERKDAGLIKPEHVPESASPWAPVEPSDHARAIREVIEEGGLKKLTPRERRALCLNAGLVVQEDGSITFQEPLDQRGIARSMRVSRRSVRMFLERAGEKLRELCRPKLGDEA